MRGGGGRARRHAVLTDMRAMRWANRGTRQVIGGDAAIIFSGWRRRTWRAALAAGCFWQCAEPSEAAKFYVERVWTRNGQH
eukprot:5679893-Prymnesium_polylepis.3